MIDCTMPLPVCRHDENAERKCLGEWGGLPGYLYDYSTSSHGPLLSSLSSLSLSLFLFSTTPTLKFLLFLPWTATSCLST